MSANSLSAALSAAVPLWIEEIRPWTEERRIERGRVCAQVVAANGDVILYKGKGTAEAFNRLAEGLACLAYQPGGVTAFGMHFEA